MAREINSTGTQSSDNTVVKGLENKSQNSEKFGTIAVDSWAEMEKGHKDANGKFGKATAKDGQIKGDVSKDDSVLIFDDPFKKGKSDNSSALQEKKMMSDEDVIRNKKEEAIENANMVQKKKELADGGKTGGKVEGALDFAPEKPKVPADGGLKDGWTKTEEFIGKKPLEGGPKDKDFTGKKALGGGTKDLSFDRNYYEQLL